MLNGRPDPRRDNEDIAMISKRILSVRRRIDEQLSKAVALRDRMLASIDEDDFPFAVPGEDEYEPS